jgi:hypothetical protein
MHSRSDREYIAHLSTVLLKTQRTIERSAELILAHKKALAVFAVLRALHPTLAVDGSSTDLTRTDEGD